MHKTFWNYEYSTTSQSGRYTSSTLCTFPLPS